MGMSAAVDAIERLHDYEGTRYELAGRLGRRAGRRRRGRGAAHPRRQGGWDLRRLKQVERLLEEAGCSSVVTVGSRSHHGGARRLGERALTQIFEERDREGPTRTTRPVTPAGSPNLPAPPGRGASATTASSRCSARCSTPSPARRRVAAGPSPSRGLRDGRGRATNRDGDRAAARPVVLDAVARSLHPREEDGARAARPDRGAATATRST